MEKLRAFLKRKNIEISAKRYGIDALGAMAQGLFCSLLIGTIVKTLGQQLGMEFLIEVGGYASAMSGAAMAVAIGYALKAPPLVLFSLVTVGYAANALGSVTLSGGSGAGGPLAQGLGTSMLQMGNIVRNPRIWLPAILASAVTGPLATCVFQFEMNDPAGGVAAGMGTCGMVGPIGVYAGWVNDVATGAKAAITGMDWLAMALICFVLPAVLAWLFGLFFRRIGWIREGDLTLE